MIEGTSINYTGRKVDLSLFPSIANSGIRVAAGVSSNPKAVAGLSMMAQNFARILLTPMGTYRGDPKMGTNFFNKLSSRSMQYPSDIKQAFLIESGRVLEYMHDAVTAATPLDEQVGSVSLGNVDLGSTSVSLRIDLVSKAGNSVFFLLPVNWTI